MSEFLTTELLDLTAETASGEGALIDTTAFPSIDKNLRPQLGKRAIKSGAALFSISSTAHSGTSMAVDVVAEVDGVDHVVGSFTDVTGTGVETIVIDFCPDLVKIVYVETAIDDWDVKIHCVRF
jgi:hypothetical protein